MLNDGGGFMKKWHVVYTKPYHEQVVATQLLQQNFDIYLPCYQRQRRHARKIEIIQAPLFPRYLFVSLKNEQSSLHAIDSTRGVSYLLRINGYPAVVPSTVIDLLKEQQDEKGCVPISTLTLFLKGQEVQIIDGCFNGQTAIFEKLDDKQRAQLLLNFLNQPISISLPVHTIKAI